MCHPSSGGIDIGGGGGWIGCQGTVNGTGVLANSA